MAHRRRRRGQDLAAMRQNYSIAGPRRGRPGARLGDPVRRWLDDAVAAGIAEPNAMVVATAGRRRAVGRADACWPRGSTRTASSSTPTTVRQESATWRPIPGPPATFPWYRTAAAGALPRSRSSRVDAARPPAYWATRPRGSQLGAWASPQSAGAAGPGRAGTAARPRSSSGSAGARTRRRDAGPGAAALGRLADRTRRRSSSGRAGTARLHDRLRYRADAIRRSGWVIERLAP